MSFTAMDTLGVLKACFALAPFTFAPGYALGWALNVFEFRQRRPLLRIILAVPLSIAICPMVSYLLARFLPPALWVFYGGATAACLLLWGEELRQAKPSLLSKHTRIALGVVMLWVVAAVFSLVDLQIGDRLYSPIAAYDHSTRVAVMSAIARHMPPSNPFFAHPAIPLRYHYLWMLLCSLPWKVFHVSARSLMYGGIVWCGLGLMCTIALGLKFFLRGQNHIAQKTLVALGLLCVTGLDILPTLYFALAGRPWLADMEWWNEVQITSWAASLLWVPHHVAALIACFVGFIVLRHEADTSGRWRIASVAVAGMAFAGAAGLSVYVTFTFVVAIGLWLLALVARKDWKEAAMFVGAGAIAAISALPYLLSLRGPGSGTAFLELAIRPFPLGLHLLGRMEISIQTRAAVMAVDAISLPINYAVELGLFLFVGILRLRQVLRRNIPVNAGELAAWTLVMASFAIGTFLKSSTITTNDLGIRCFLPAQLILLLWGATMVHEWWLDDAAAQPAPGPWARRAVAVLLILGVFGTAYETFMIRMAPLLRERVQVAGLGWLDSDRQSAKRTYALRSLYESLDAQLPASAVIQHNPVTQNVIVHALYSGHDAAAGSPDCGTAFGGDPEVCGQRVLRLAALFEIPGGNPDDACQAYGIDVIVAKDTDGAWRNASSWIWTQRPVFANNYVRAFRCRSVTVAVH